MAQPSTPSGPHTSIFGSANGLQSPAAFSSAHPASAASSSTNTYIMPSSPLKTRTPVDGGYRPRVTRTLGQKPSCLVNATLNYCGNNQLLVFGGFDQFSDEVYNHVLKLDLVSHQWSLVDNYGDIPGVRMGRSFQL